MSYQAQTWVTVHSRHKGSALLLLLIIANHAHADGTNAFPSVETLARETRMSKRQVNRLILLIEKSGELLIQRGGGRASNTYSLPKMTETTPDKMSPPDGRAGVTQLRQGSPDTQGASPDIAMSPKQRNRKRKVKEPAAGAAEFKTVPLQNRLFKFFKECYELPKNYGVPYIGKKGKLNGDFSQLAILIKAYPDGLLESLWRQAVKNYFTTPQTSRTLADLCVRFADFQKAPLDKFKQLVVDDKKPSGPPTEEELRLAEDEKSMKEHFKRIEERKNAQQTAAPK